MKTTIKIMIVLCLFSGLYFWVSTYAEWQKVIIDPATKKIIIQSWDQNLDLEALKAESQVSSWNTENVVSSWATVVATWDNTASEEKK